MANIVNSCPANKSAGMLTKTQASRPRTGPRTEGSRPRPGPDLSIFNTKDTTKDFCL